MSADIGLIGLGTMGAALALNIADHGFDIAVFNRTARVTEDFVAGAGNLAPRLTGAGTLETLVGALKTPRVVLLMVPAGQPVDDQIEALKPLLDDGDMIIDGGNANFHDTNRRMEALPGQFLGLGVSGGEDGARHGPAMMAGGPKELWDRVAPILTAIAAKHEGEPCAAWMGEDGAGHFVKAVHNGIEYADMQLIAEVYGLMRDGLGMAPDAVAEVFGRWNEGALASYLIEITAIVAGAVDGATGEPLLEVIADAAGQKGTGRWTVIEAQHLGAPVTVIDAAVAARNMSGFRDLRQRLSERFAGPEAAVGLDMGTLEAALIAAKVLAYAQGFDMIAAARDRFGWSLDAPTIARTWRAGCIIRSAMLDDMATALERAPGETLMAAEPFAGHLDKGVPALRAVLAAAVAGGHPAPALSQALGYFDTMRQARGTANMIQGQRDYFGRHGFVRLDTGEDGQHGPWA